MPPDSRTSCTPSAPATATATTQSRRSTADRIQQRVDCLSRNRDAILACLAVVEASQKPES
ncbi:hypothetical protein EDD27_4279 [Nonomuraea polychroma]|uniref:Uncharacterized protein n=1 Tax=Nonomuraea polychroma TaxID=46176 RepID=A0A438M7L9_9ACTN|nr:hypothetical protein EDD27_4279 [Nonomuraea polychroma]